MNPLIVSAATIANFLAMFILAKFSFLWLVSLFPPSPARDGLVALVM